MADDKHYVPGDFYRICERTGFKLRAGHTRKEWTGRLIREQSWEPRQPQDFVAGVQDDQTVPDPRPRQIDVFIGPLATQLTAPVAARGQVLEVQSSVRMEIGDTVRVLLDNGEYFQTTITDWIDTTRIQVGNLPYSASSGNVVMNISAYAQPNLTQSGVP